MYIHYISTNFVQKTVQFTADNNCPPMYLQDYSTVDQCGGDIEL